MKKLTALLLVLALLAGCGGTAAAPAASSVPVQTEEQLEKVLSGLSQSAAPAQESAASEAPESKAPSPAAAEASEPSQSAAASSKAPAAEQGGLRPDAGVFTADAGTTADSAGKVTMSIDCSQASALGTMSWLPADGWILKASSFEIEEGETAFTLLARVAREKKLQMEYNGTKATAYIKGIDNLYEKDCGDLSGWMIRVNGDVISVGSGQCALYDGDEVEWFYALDYTKEG